jgi:hypothetical protein
MNAKLWLGVILGLGIGVSVRGLGKFQTGSCDPLYKDNSLMVASSTKDGVGLSPPTNLSLFVRGTGESHLRGAFYDPDRTDFMLVRDLRK